MARRIAVFTFIAVIWIPLLSGFAPSSDKPLPQEKRALAAKPPFPGNASELVEYPRSFQDYYQDHFGFRDELAYAFHRLKYALGDSPSKKVVRGKQGWLFLNGAVHNDPLGDYRNLNPFSESALQDYVKELAGKSRFLARQGVGYLFVVAPNKHSIYPDMLPDFVQQSGEHSALDQLLDALEKQTDVITLDLRRTLRDGRTSAFDSYYKTDTHWNAWGANLAQYEMARSAAALTGGRIKPRRFEMADFRLESEGSGDLAFFAGLSQLLGAHNPLLSHELCGSGNWPANGRDTHTIKCLAKGPVALVFRDSFFTPLQPYFANYFSSSTYVWKSLNPRELIDQLSQSSVDLVVEELVERSLPVARRPASLFISEANGILFEQGQLLKNAHGEKAANILLSNPGWQAGESLAVKLTILASKPSDFFVAVVADDGVSVRLSPSTLTTRLGEQDYFFLLRDAPNRGRLYLGLANGPDRPALISVSIAKAPDLRRFGKFGSASQPIECCKP